MSLLLSVKAFCISVPTKWTCFLKTDCKHAKLISTFTEKRTVSQSLHQAWCLGLERLFGNVSVSSKSGKASVVSNRKKTEGHGLGTQCLILQTHFQRQKFTQVSTNNKLSVGLISTAWHSCSLCFLHAVDLLNSCIIKYLYCLVLNLIFSHDMAVHAIGQMWIRQKVKRHIHCLKNTPQHFLL